MPVEGAVWSWELESCSNEKKSYVCVCVRACNKKQNKKKRSTNGQRVDWGQKKKVKKKNGGAYPGLPLATPLWESDGPRPITQAYPVAMPLDLGK